MLPTGSRSKPLLHRVCLFAIAAIIATIFASGANGDFYDVEKSADDRLCFCQLQGTIEDCECSVNTVDSFNNVKIYPRLQSLLVKDYFRYFRVNLKHKCPFWEDDSRCAMKFCSVQACDQRDIPVGLQGEAVPVNKYTEAAQKAGCSEDDDLGYLNTSISATAQRAHERWERHDETQENFCILDDNLEGEYVDLLLNPERYTGYKGESAHRVWRTIYQENCFLSTEGKSYSAFVPQTQRSPLRGLCLEERAFYRMVSGLHSSINIHLCANYLLSEKRAPMEFASPAGVWGPNLDEFRNRFSPSSSDGEGPQWLRNLYFAYLIELRALAKVAPYLKQELFFTGNDEADQEVQVAVRDLLTVIESFPAHFNESTMFADGSETSLKLKNEFRAKFRNISKIMDCVGCDKCRLWGKLQTQGMGTALKILFSNRFDRNNKAGINDKERFKLKRTEIVSLLNAFGRLSNSIYSLEKFREQLR